MSKKHTMANLKTPLLNDCTNHLSSQLNSQKPNEKHAKKHIDSLYETPVGEVVTEEFIKGYN